MESKKQNKLEKDEVNELKSKHAEETQKNEELNEYIMPLQNDIMISAVGHKDQPSNKVISKKMISLFIMFIYIMYFIT